MRLCIAVVLQVEHSTAIVCLFIIFVYFYFLENVIYCLFYYKLI